jgi:hypothetical protein
LKNASIQQEFTLALDALVAQSKMIVQSLRPSYVAAILVPKADTPAVKSW